MKILIVAAALAAALGAPAFAAPAPTPVYTTSVNVGYDPNAPTSNFSSPGTTNSETAYTVRTGIDANYFYVDTTATPTPGTTVTDQFSNIYFGGLTFNPGLIFEVGNDRVSTTTDPSNYYSLAGTGFSYSQSTNDISFALPLSFLENDPLGIGFTKVAAGDEIRVSYSQSFGYSFDGGSAAYGQARLGEQIVPAAAVSAAPEPATWALMLGGVGAMGLMLRSRRRQPKLARVTAA